MTRLDLFPLVVDSIFYRCPNPVFINIVFAFGLIWAIIRVQRDKREKVYSPRSSTSSAQEVFCTLFYAQLSPLSMKKKRLSAYVAAILRYNEITSGRKGSRFRREFSELHNPWIGLDKEPLAQPHQAGGDGRQPQLPQPQRR
jgi:hypothetical protein